MDYKSLGFRCGLEIHQQLDTKTKLFCNCPAKIRDDQPDIVVKRKLRASAGETGEIDAAVKHEMQKGKEFIYNGYNNATCNVELDEEPIHNLNDEALRIALQVALMLNARIADNVQIMRKTVVDGSNTSGFQRTMLIARDGKLETSKGNIGIPTICLEEDAAKTVKKTPEADTYNLSRLGIPLIEIGTDASIKDPEHAKETAEKLGMILRSTGKVARGIGTIRQDVNLSIKGGERVEIKGFQDLRQMPKIIENEITRQLAEIKSGKKPEKEVRKAEPDGTTKYLRPMPGSARMYPETDAKTIRPDTEGITLPKLIVEKATEYEELGLGEDLAMKISKAGQSKLFEKLLELKNIKPAFMAETLISYEKAVKKEDETAKPELITEEHITKIFTALNNEEITKDRVMALLLELAQGKPFEIKKQEAISEQELLKAIKEVAESNKDKTFGALMGIAMAKMQGKADGKRISETLRKFVHQ